MAPGGSRTVRGLRTEGSLADALPGEARPPAGVRAVGPFADWTRGAEGLQTNRNISSFRDAQSPVRWGAEKKLDTRLTMLPADEPKTTDLAGRGEFTPWSPGEASNVTGEATFGEAETEEAMASQWGYGESINGCFYFIYEDGTKEPDSAAGLNV
ncbi:hypothetical protein NDU88_001443 [Pleurodeles waltl]|uniref:Uncharacterized protein n=1 Tax=Pleurodeles waltl TaxID=8319 RepID=A0AAV7TIV6_PLEWA|nr:hypothetical protein NDU88_001443 [Pleurodeles waltl]